MGGRAVTTRISSPTSTTVLYLWLLAPLLAPLLATRFGKTSNSAPFAACAFCYYHFAGAELPFLVDHFVGSTLEGWVALDSRVFFFPGS
jgi:hypothetical protein